MDKSTALYNQIQTVESWGHEADLQIPEKIIFSIFKDSLSNFRFLDVGVGCGRTSLYFAPYVKEYIGIDIAPEMVNYSKRRFEHLKDTITFNTMDASDLSKFPENYFDFILFSYNGIDHMNIEDRYSFFVEARRVLKSTGILAYSSHNLNMIHKYYIKKFHTEFNLNPITLSKKYVNYLHWHYKLRTLNKNYRILKKEDWVIFRDGAFNFKMTMLFSKPNFEIKNLMNFGFNNIKIIDLHGNFLNKNELEEVMDPWLYYLCTVEK